MFGLNGKLKTQAGQRDELVGHLLKAAAMLREMDGCYLYVVYSLPDEPDTVSVFEVWRSQADHQASLQVAAIQELIAAARPLLAGAPDGYPITPLGGVGLPDTAS